MRFYLDLFLIRTTLTNCLILLSTFYILKIPLSNKKIKIVAAAVSGALISAVILIVSGNYNLYRIVTLFFIGPGMIYTLCGHAERTLNIWIVAVISTFLTGGAVCAIDQVTGREAFSKHHNFICDRHYFLEYNVFECKAE